MGNDLGDAASWRVTDEKNAGEPAGFKIVRSCGSGGELIAKLRCRLAADEFDHQSAREADVDVSLPVVLTPIVPHDRAD